MHMLLKMETWTRIASDFENLLSFIGTIDISDFFPVELLYCCEIAQTYPVLEFVIVEEMKEKEKDIYRF